MICNYNQTKTGTGFSNYSNLFNITFLIEIITIYRFYYLNILFCESTSYWNNVMTRAAIGSEICDSNHDIYNILIYFAKIFI